MNDERVLSSADSKHLHPISCSSDPLLDNGILAVVQHVKVLLHLIEPEGS